MTIQSWLREAYHKVAKVHESYVTLEFHHNFSLMAYQYFVSQFFQYGFLLIFLSPGFAITKSFSLIASILK